MTYRSFIAAVCAAAAFAAPAFAGGITAIDPYARAASPNAKAGAAFMMLRNDTGKDDTLIAARSEVARRVELHTHLEVSDGIMQMTQIKGGIPLMAHSHHVAGVAMPAFRTTPLKRTLPLRKQMNQELRHAMTIKQINQQRQRQDAQS